MCDAENIIESAKILFRKSDCLSNKFIYLKKNFLLYTKVLVFTCNIPPVLISNVEISKFFEKLGIIADSDFCRASYTTFYTSKINMNFC